MLTVAGAEGKSTLRQSLPVEAALSTLWLGPILRGKLAFSGADELMSTVYPSDSPALSTQRRCSVQAVRIRNYKSIGQCDVALHPLTVLVGRNGAGKSNFLDALRFVTDSLQASLDHALKSRGGIGEVRRRSTGHPRNFSIRLQLDLPGMQTAYYGFEIAALTRGGFAVKQESVRILKPNGEVAAEYRVEDGSVARSVPSQMPPAVSDRLYLVSAAGLPEFRTLYDVLVSMGFYSLNPEEMKKPQSPDAGELLHRDGGNIASVVARIGAEQPELKDRIKAYLTTIISGIVDVDRVTLGPLETLEFQQRVSGSPHPWKFYASSMSDGTLRAIGALVAVAQLSDRKKPVALVGIEEPETALHPAAAGALVDSLREAAAHTQVVVTTHSPDFLEQANLDSDGILVVQVNEGDTSIGPIDAASSQAIKDHLYSVGEMLRMDQLDADHSDLERQLRIPFNDLDDAEAV